MSEEHRRESRGEQPSPAEEVKRRKLLFPIVLKTDAAEPDLPDRKTPLYYEVAANGVFQVREAKTHRAVTRVEHDVPGLVAERESVELFFPRVPREQSEDVLAFFHEVFQRFGGEAIVILFYDPAREAFEIGVPPQTIESFVDTYGRSYTDYHLDYGNIERPPGCVRLGTIHSHGALPAYASHTDCEDERYGDGLHIVFGQLTRDRISQSAAFVANGRRFPLDPKEVLEPAGIPLHEAPREWLDKVEYVESTRRYAWVAEPVPIYSVPSTGARIIPVTGEDDVEH